ncbi:MAG: S8 family peptidase [Flavobacteriales bacterium]|nr:S8 family peptidase [Flavobacteriales bacterium]MBK9598817.1 S8 family peptidase [Flavobacteriales bacterium]
MIRSLILASLLFTTALHAQTPMPAETRVGIAELQAVALRQPDAHKLTAEAQGKYPVAMMGGRCMVGFLGKVNDTFDPDELDPSIVHVGARIGDVLSFRVDAYHLLAASAIPGLAYAELAGIAKPTLDKLVTTIHADSVQQGINLPQPYTGEGVLIGDLDWGFDYTHPMFYDTALTNYRVRAAWDQFRQAGPAPATFGYGAEFTTPATLLAAQGDTSNIYTYGTHGTHVAGIMGGGGAGTIYRGVAFDAQFLFCSFLIDAAAALDGVAWMQQVAQQDGKRLVVNMSWGLYYMGTLDGHSLISQALDQFSAEGVVFSISAGNNGDIAFHIGKTFTGDTLRSRVQFYPYSAHPHMWGQSLTMWGEPNTSFSANIKVFNSNNALVMETPWYHTATQATYVDSLLIASDDTVFFNLTAEAANPLNDRPHFRLRIKNTNTTLRVIMQATAPSGTVHFWNVTELDNDVGNWGQEFQTGVPGGTAGDTQYGIGEPACAESAITVAACSSIVGYSPTGNPIGGNIASFSSFGPTLDGRIKPDITAPGSNVASSISSFTDNAFSPLLTVPFQGRDYPFARFSGTSMSAPAVTGAVALMLQADPTLTPAQIRDIIRQTAITDNYTGTIPPGGSTRWGMGKLNAYHAVTQLLGVTGVNEAGEPHLSVWPNPASGMLFVSPPFATDGAQLYVTDALGRTVLSRALNSSGAFSVDGSGWPSGVYFLRMEKEGQCAVGKVVRE